MTSHSIRAFAGAGALALGSDHAAHGELGDGGELGQVFAVRPKRKRKSTADERGSVSK